MAGLSEPAAGRLRLEGAAEPEDFAEEVHYLGHLDAHKAALSAEEISPSGAPCWAGRRSPSAEAMEEVGLGGLGGLPVAVLSAGQKRRLALARLLVAERPLWLLDEPTTALDVAAQARFAALARAHVEKGGMIVAATHAPLDLGPSDALDLGARRPASPIASVVA